MTKRTFEIEWDDDDRILGNIPLGLDADSVTSSLNGYYPLTVFTVRDVTDDLKTALKTAQDSPVPLFQNEDREEE